MLATLNRPYLVFVFSLFLSKFIVFITIIPTIYFPCWSGLVFFLIEQDKNANVNKIIMVKDGIHLRIKSLSSNTKLSKHSYYQVWTRTKSAVFSEKLVKLMQNLLKNTNTQTTKIDRKSNKQVNRYRNT